MMRRLPWWTGVLPEQQFRGAKNVPQNPGSSKFPSPGQRNTDLNGLLGRRALLLWLADWLEEARRLFLVLLALWLFAYLLRWVLGCL